MPWGLTRGGVGGGVNRRLDSAGDCCTGSGDEGVLSGGAIGDCGDMALRYVSAGSDDVDGR